MELEIGCELRYRVAEPTTFVLAIFATRLGEQKILDESFTTSPALDWEFGSSHEAATRIARAAVPAGEISIAYRATVAPSCLYDDPDRIPEVASDRLPLETLQYLNPSRYCESDKIREFACTQFGALLPGYARVNAICNWIYANLKYLGGSTSSTTSAIDTLAQREGVCRDFAHLGIALCRALNIPARFVAAYAPGLVPQDFHAYFEAYLGTRWYVFDPTRMARQNALVRIGIGRDAADVSFATLFGTCEMQHMRIIANLIDPPESTLQSPEMTLAAVATL